MTVASVAQRPTGIASIGLHLPPLSMAVEELASLRGQEPEKYTIGLGCSEMSLCPPGYGVVELATEAARRALDRWEDLSRAWYREPLTLVHGDSHLGNFFDTGDEMGMIDFQGTHWSRGTRDVRICAWSVTCWGISAARRSRTERH